MYTKSIGYYKLYVVIS
jgi:serine/threonine protein kinase